MVFKLCCSCHIWDKHGNKAVVAVTLEISMVIKLCCSCHIRNKHGNLAVL